MEPWSECQTREVIELVVIYLNKTLLFNYNPHRFALIVLENLNKDYKDYMRKRFWRNRLFWQHTYLTSRRTVWTQIFLKKYWQVTIICIFGQNVFPVKHHQLTFLQLSLTRRRTPLQLHYYVLQNNDRKYRFDVTESTGSPPKSIQSHRL